MPLPHRLPDPLVEEIARRLRALGEPTRIRLLERLRHGDATVRELSDAVDATQQNVSQHLGVLLRAGMVLRTKHGTRCRYTLVDPGAFAVFECVWESYSRHLSDLHEVVNAGSAPAA